MYKYLDTLDVDLMFLQEAYNLNDTCGLVRHYPYKAGGVVLSKYPIQNCRRYKIEEDDCRYQLLVDSIRNKDNQLQNNPSIYSTDIEMPMGTEVYIFTQMPTQQPGEL